MTDQTAEERAQAFVEHLEEINSVVTGLFGPSLGVPDFVTDAIDHIKALLAVNAKLHERLAALEAATAQLLSCPNWENRIGPWTDINKAVRRLAEAGKEDKLCR